MANMNNDISTVAKTALDEGNLYIGVHIDGQWHPSYSFNRKTQVSYGNLVNTLKGKIAYFLSCYIPNVSSEDDLLEVGKYYECVVTVGKPPWSVITNVSHVESLDTLVHLIPNDGTIQYVKGGDVLETNLGQTTIVPTWLLAPLPKRIPFSSESPIDLSLPVDSNVFCEVINPFNVRNLMHETRRGVYDYSLLLGCSGCGKTTTCRVLASLRFVVFLECPQSAVEQGVSKGYSMSPSLWTVRNNPNIRHEDHARYAFYAEVAARLIVLKHLLIAMGKRLTPQCWLLFTMSDDGSRRICGVFDEIVREQLCINHLLVNQLLGDVNELLAELHGNEDPRSVPVLVVDEVHAFADRTVPTWGKEPTSMMRTIVNAAWALDIAAIWSGTMSVSSAINETAVVSGTTSFGKPLIGHRKIKIVGDFKYLQPEQVELLLNKILDLRDVPSYVKTQLYHGLQGRGSICAGFVTFLLSPNSAAMKEDALLSDTILDVFKCYIQTKVMGRVRNEVREMSTDHVGLVWCHAMLPGMKSHVSEVSRLNSVIPFTKCVIVRTLTGVRAKNIAVGGGTVIEVTPDMYLSVSDTDNTLSKCSYEYVLGEPFLQTALLNIVREDIIYADKGIALLLQFAQTEPENSVYLHYAVTLSLLTKRMSDLVKGTPYKTYSNYTLSLSHVVSNVTVEQQQEWFQRVLLDPEDCSYSLLPGVPVKNIMILTSTQSTQSSADMICVAVNSGCDDQLCLEKIGDKRKHNEEELQQLVFVHVNCITSVDSVTNVNVHSIDQEMVLTQYTKGHVVLPILVEIPHKDSVVSDDRILVTEQFNTQKLFCSEVTDLLYSLCDGVGGGSL